MKSRMLSLFTISLVFLALVVSPLVSPAVAQPQLTFTVTTNTDMVDATPGDGLCETATGNETCTLRAAIMEANARIGADTIILPAAEYNLTLAGDDEDECATGDLDITENLTITGAGSGETIIDAEDLNDRVLGILATTQAMTMTGLTIQHGATFDEGGGILSLSPLFLEDVRLFHNAAGVGGAIYGLADLNLKAVVIEQNSAFVQGGGIYIRSVNLYAEDTDFIDNSVEIEGGAVYACLYSDIQMVRTNFSFNTSLEEGGAIYLSSTGLEIDDGTISEGDAGNVAGGIYVGEGSTATLTDISLSGNKAVMAGGSVYIDVNATLNGENLRFIENSTDHYGGAIYNHQAEVHLTGSRFQENSADNGGAIVTSGLSTTTIESTTIISNTAVGVGGGIANTGNLTMRGVTIHANRAQLGGGVNNLNVLLIENSTVSENSAKEDGGGLLVSGGDAGSIYVYNSTITANTAGTDLLHPGGTGGGVYITEGSNAEVRNSILSGNHHRQLTIFVDDDCKGTLQSGDYNLIGTLSGCTLAVPQGHDLIGVDPLLGKLANNGGPTQTYALLEGSPAIDGGNPDGCLGINGVLLTSDQRGVVRPLDGDKDGTSRCDIGAFEVSTYVSVYLPLTVK